MSHTSILLGVSWSGWGWKSDKFYYPSHPDSFAPETASPLLASQIHHLTFPPCSPVDGFLFSWAQWVERSDSIILVNSLYYPTEDEMFLLLQRSQKEAIAEEFKSPNYWVRQACMQVSAVHWLALCIMLPAKWRGNHNAFFSLSQMSTEKLAILKSLFCSDPLRNLIYFIQWNDPTCRMVH